MPANPLAPSKIGTDRYIKAQNIEIALTATAGGAQGGTPITAQANRVDTCASGADSITLPKIGAYADGSAQLAPVGHIVFVRNAGAASCQVFGSTPDTINAAATGTGVAVANTKSAIFVALDYVPATNVGNWMMVLSA